MKPHCASKYVFEAGKPRTLHEATTLQNDGQAILPESSLRLTLADMEVGESWYASPSAMVVDAAHRCWLNLNCAPGKRSESKVQIVVYRKPDGFYVNLDKDIFFSPSTELDTENEFLVPVKGLLFS